MADAENIKIAVRVRPFMRHLEHEKDPEMKSIVEMEGRRCYVYDPEKPDAKPKEGQFNYCFWSHEPSDPHYLDQGGVFDSLGMDVFNASWEGYNSTLFAYGQSGSGKTYSMTGGKGEHEGIIPRCCRKLLESCEEDRQAGKLKNYDIKISIVFIYLEKISDLLTTDKKTKDLKCGNIPGGLGWGVPEAKRIPCLDYAEIEKNLDLSEKRKVVSGTGLNATSSRGHTVLTIFFNRLDSSDMQTTCKINLVDLAGSERLGKTGVSGLQAEEGRSINLSLTNLGNVIRALGATRKKVVPPYRQSQLTMVLKESLSQNSKTIMIAALNPCPSNHDETISTLVFADGVSKVKLPAKKNVQSMAAKRASLQNAEDKINELMAQLMEKESLGQQNQMLSEQLAQMQRELEEARAAQADSEMSFEERRTQAKRGNAERDEYLARMGLLAENLPEDAPRLISMSEDPFMDGKLVFGLAEGQSTLSIGKSDEEGGGEQPDVALESPQVASLHCRLEDDGGEYYLTPLYNTDEGRFETSVNGEKITKKTKLSQYSRIWIGTSFVFKFHDPKQPEPDFEVNYKKAYMELLKRDGYKDPEEVERELKENEERLKAELEAQMKAQREESEAKMKEAQAKLMEDMERQRKEMQERSASEEEMKAKLEAAQKEMLKKQEEAERERRELMQKFEDEKNSQLRRQQQEANDKIHKTRLENKLSELVPMVRQANMYAHDLGRPVSFEGRIKQMNFDSGVSGGTYSNADTVVEISKKWNGSKSYMDFDSFRDRFQEMTMTYESVKEALANGTPLDIPVEQDPFYFKNVPEMFGQAFVFMFSLASGMGTSMDEEDGEVEESPISDVSKSNTDVGMLKYRIDINEDEGEGEGGLERQDTDAYLKTPAGPPIGSELKFTISITEIDSLKSVFGNDVFLQYKFYDERRPRTSQPLEGAVHTQKLDWSEDFKVVVTKSLLDYLQSDPLMIQVWGSAKEEEIPDGVRVNMENATLTALGKPVGGVVSTKRPSAGGASSSGASGSGAGSSADAAARAKAEKEAATLRKELEELRAAMKGGEGDALKKIQQERDQLLMELERARKSSEGSSSSSGDVAAAQERERKAIAEKERLQRELDAVRGKPAAPNGDSKACATQ